MMLESGYQEPLFLRGTQTVTEKLQESIPALLRENHGAGIIGGEYGAELPVCLISELAVKMLGYESSAEFETAAGGRMSALLYPSRLTVPQFAALSGSEETHLRAKSGLLWMRIVKRLTDMLGGSISVRSRLNAGTTFTVVLPFHRDNSASVAEDVVKCREAGMNAHLPKPFKVDQLVSAIADRRK